MEIEEGTRETNKRLLLSVANRMMRCLNLVTKNKYSCYNETQRYFQIKSSVLEGKAPTVILLSESSELQRATLIKRRWWEFETI